MANYQQNDNLVPGGSRYTYGAAGWHVGAHVRFLPGAACSIDNNDTGYTGWLDRDGSEYTFVGSVNLLHDVFTSDENDPLVFKLVKDVGAVYVSGKGTVVAEDGKELVRIPASLNNRSGR